LTGGRGSLKSTTVHDFIARLTYEKGHGILFTRYTLTSAELSIIPEFKTTLDRLQVADDFHITKQTITNKHTGSFIYFSGIKTSSGDQTAKLKSIAGVTTWVIEEGEDFRSEKTFDTIDDSIRTTAAQNRIIWIQNPTTKEHFIYQRWIEPKSRKADVSGFAVTVSGSEEVEHIHTTYRLAQLLGYLASDWIEKAEKSKRQMEELVKKAEARTDIDREQKDIEVYKIRHTSHYYYNYIGGWLEQAEGVVFDNWIEGDFDNTLPYLHGLDYGYNPDPLALVKVAVDSMRMKIYVKQLIYETQINDVPLRFNAEQVAKHILTVTDVNEPRTNVALKKAGYNVEPAIKLPGSIANDIRDIKKYTIVVDKDSSELKMELNNYVWNDKKSSIPVDDFNHSLDAMRYAFRRLTIKTTSGVRRRN